MILELKRSEGFTQNRLSYFTDIKVVLPNKCAFTRRFRIDTGAVYSIVGMEALDKEVSDYIYKFGKVFTCRDIVDASGNNIKIFRVKVEKFIISRESNIIIDNMELFFSPDLGSNVLLGMDILSLFEFKYIREKSQLVGTFFLINPEKSIKFLYNNFTKKGKTISPRGVLYIKDIRDINVIDTKEFRLICKSKEKTGNKITRYTIYDKETDKSRVVTAKELREILKTHKIGNVTLTSDNKIRTSKSVKIINKEKNIQ